MQDIFLQVTLSLSGAFVGALVQLMPPKWQIYIVKVLGGLLVAILLVWVGYELGSRFS
jgi:hypothetical protein